MLKMKLTKLTMISNDRLDWIESLSFIYKTKKNIT